MPSTDLTTFAFKDQRVRVVELDGAPWFVAADVFRAIGMAVGGAAGGTAKRLGFIQSDELRTVRRAEEKEFPLLFGGTNASAITLISESGLYKLILRAQRKNPAVAQFQDWVTRVVLPAIRKDGAYIAGELRGGLSRQGKAFHGPPLGDHQIAARAVWAAVGVAETGGSRARQAARRHSGAMRGPRSRAARSAVLVARGRSPRLSRPGARSAGARATRRAVLLGPPPGQSRRR
jgi:prophage antirepressor-like protein